MAEFSLSRRSLLSGALASGALIAAPADIKIAPKVTLRLGLPKLPLPLPTLSRAAAQEVVPTYILPPIYVYPPEPDFSNNDFGIGYGQGYYLHMIQTMKLQWEAEQKAKAAEIEAQRQAIADRWTALYNAWLEQFGPDAARIATELQWAGLEAAQAITVIALLEAGAGAIEKVHHVMKDAGVIAFIAQALRSGSLSMVLQGITAGFAVYLTGPAIILASLAIFYIVVVYIAPAVISMQYIGLQPLDGPQEYFTPGVPELYGP
jgi:hypothetical protein